MSNNTPMERTSASDSRSSDASGLKAKKVSSRIGPRRRHVTRFRSTAISPAFGRVAILSAYVPFHRTRATGVPHRQVAQHRRAHIGILGYHGIEGILIVADQFRPTLQAVVKIIEKENARQLNGSQTEICGFSLRVAGLSVTVRRSARIS